MKKLNLVVAIIYTVLLSLTVLNITDDVETLIGVMLISVPVVVNWITWSKL